MDPVDSQLVINKNIQSGHSAYLRKIESSDENNITKLDLEHYIQSNVNEEKEIDKEILANALNLNLLKVRDCMIPAMK